MAGDRRERADAADNRRRILVAARELLEADGVEGLTMQAVATAAGVGKGTVFHRFGDRDGLLAELIDTYMRDFQDRFLSGPPPLGPGAPPLERLEAFFTEYIALQLDHLSAALAAHTSAEAAGAVGHALGLHVQHLLAGLDAGFDVVVVGEALLGAVAPPVLARMRGQGADVAAMQRGVATLVRALGDGTPGADRPA